MIILEETKQEKEDQHNQKQQIVEHITLMINLKKDLEMELDLI